MSLDVTVALFYFKPNLTEYGARAKTVLVHFQQLLAKTPHAEVYDPCLCVCVCVRGH